MDFMTLLGFVGGVILLMVSITREGALGVFMNPHGLTIVLGGTLFATMINSSFRETIAFVKAGVSLFLKPKSIAPDQVIFQVVRLAGIARRSGVMAIQEEEKDIGDDGFFEHAIEVVLTANDEKVARVILEKEINQIRLRHREVGNIFRTAGLLSPMFGLLGTLIGIISVLKNISEPTSVGPAMAVAISSAFYGILMANLVFVPGAGKLRTRSLEEILYKEIVTEGMINIVFTAKIPIVIEMQLLSYLQGGKRSEESGGASAPVSA